MTKKVPKKILRIEGNFFVNLRKKLFLAAHAAPTPSPIFLDRRRAATDRNWQWRWRTALLRIQTNNKSHYMYNYNCNCFITSLYSHKAVDYCYYWKV